MDKMSTPLLLLIASSIVVLISLLTPKIPARIIQLAMITFGVSLFIVLTVK